MLDDDEVGTSASAKARPRRPLRSRKLPPRMKAEKDWSTQVRLRRSFIRWPIVASLPTGRLIGVNDGGGEPTRWKKAGSAGETRKPRLSWKSGMSYVISRQWRRRFSRRPRLPPRSTSLDSWPFPADVVEHLDADVVDPHLTHVDLANDLELDDQPRSFGLGLNDVFIPCPAANPLQLLLEIRLVGAAAKRAGCLCSG